jgi:hypothetical protein
LASEDGHFYSPQKNAKYIPVIEILLALLLVDGRGTSAQCHLVVYRSWAPYIVVIASQSESFCYTYVGDLKMAAPSEEKLICDKFNMEALTVNQVKVSKLWQTGKMFSLELHVSNQKTFYTEHILSTKCKQKWHRNALI